MKKIKKFNLLINGFCLPFLFVLADFHFAIILSLFKKSDKV